MDRNAYGVPAEGALSNPVPGGFLHGVVARATEERATVSTYLAKEGRVRGRKRAERVQLVHEQSLSSDSGMPQRGSSPGVNAPGRHRMHFLRAEVPTDSGIAAGGTTLPGATVPPAAQDNRASAAPGSVAGRGQRKLKW